MAKMRGKTYASPSKAVRGNKLSSVKITKSLAGSALSHSSYKTKTGGEEWVVRGSGGEKTITTSATSARTMDRAVAKYDKTLKSLAER